MLESCSFPAPPPSAGPRKSRSSIVAISPEARQAIRAREQMLRVVSHDLRNPIGAIYAHADLLLDTLPNKENAPERLWVETIQRAAEHMNRLVCDLLDVSSIESGELSLDLVPREAPALLDEAVTMLRPLAAEKSLWMAASVAPGTPPVLADGERILQVLSNLIGNAISFSAPGGTILLHAGGEGDAVCFSVADTGGGISAEDLPYLFEPFWTARQPEREGTGLGLAIVRGIVEAHGGWVRAESRIDVGSTFFFTLPAASCNNAPERRRTHEVACADCG